MILSPEIYNKIKSVVFTRLEPPTTTVFWAKPSIPEGNSFDFFVYDRGEWQPLSSYENVIIPNVDAHLSAFINDAGFYIVPLGGIPLSDLSSTVQQALENAYQKPSTGIPKGDLDAAVQSSLNKADTALQSFTETDPTVPEWAKQPNKPSYTAAEVGALSPNSTLNGTKIQNDTVSSRALTEEARYKDLNQVRAFTEALEYSFITFPEVAREVLHGANGYVLLSDNKIWYWNGTSLQMLAGSTIRGTIYANLKTGVCYVVTLSGLAPIVGPDGSITLDKLSTEVLDYIDSHGGGEAVQSDWNQNDSTAMDFIKNKPAIPVIPTNVSSFNNDAGYLTQHQDISNLATKAELATHTENGNIHVTLTDKANWNAKANSSDIPDVSGYVDGAVYDSNAKRINFKHGNTVVAYIDASPFIVDGMVDTVEIVNGNLIITWNTDAGKQATSIPLTNIFNPANYYNKTEVDTLLGAKANSADLASVATTGNYEDIGNAPSGLSYFQNDAGYLTQHQSLANYYTKTEIDTMIGDINTILASI